MLMTYVRPSVKRAITLEARLRDHGCICHHLPLIQCPETRPLRVNEATVTRRYFERLTASRRAQSIRGKAC